MMDDKENDDDDSIAHIYTLGVREFRRRNIHIIHYPMIHIYIMSTHLYHVNT